MIKCLGTFSITSDKKKREMMWAYIATQPINFFSRFFEFFSRKPNFYWKKIS